MEKDLVSVICVNWNGGENIRRTMDSLFAQSYSPLEVIVVDNNSEDGSVDIIKNDYTQIILIENKTNLGWGGGLNTGIKKAQGKYIVTLNNDAWLDKNCIEEMVRVVTKDAAYGSCAAKIYLRNKDLIEVAGVKIYTDGLSCARGRLQPGDEYGQEEEVFCASGCCGLFKKEMMDDIGLYEEGFFLYAEDTEFGWRHQLAGWRCVYNPKAVVYHAHSFSSGDYSYLKAFHVERNRIWVALKYYPVVMLMFKVPFFSVVRYLYQVFLSVIHKKGALSRFREESSLLKGLSILIKAHWSALLGSPYYIKQRRRILKRISTKNILTLFRKYGCSLKEIVSYE